MVAGTAVGIEAAGTAADTAVVGIEAAGTAVECWLNQNVDRNLRSSFPFPFRVHSYCTVPCFRLDLGLFLT